MTKEERPSRVHRATRIGGVPLAIDIDAWFAELDRFAGVPLMEDGRQQPQMPLPKKSFE